MSNAIKTSTAKTSTAKPAAAAVQTRKTSLFTLTTKVNIDDLGTGQRVAIAKILKKRSGATRGQLIIALPDVPPANISWHLSKMIAAKLAKKDGAEVMQPNGAITLLLTIRHSLAKG